MSRQPRKHQLAIMRAELGTQAEVAEQLGLVRETISRYEQLGDEAPSWYWLALKGLAMEKRNA